MVSHGPNVGQQKKSLWTKVKQWFGAEEELKGMSIHLDSFGEIRPAMSTAEIGTVGREICRMVKECCG